jgi:hypothetical protein
MSRSVLTVLACARGITSSRAPEKAGRTVRRADEH